MLLAYVVAAHSALKQLRLPIWQLKCCFEVDDLVTRIMHHDLPVEGKQPRFNCSTFWAGYVDARFM